MTEYIVNVTQEFVDLYGWQLREEIIRCDSCKYYDERATSNVYPNRHWCDKLAAYTPPNGFCSFGKPRWLVCKCGEEIETTGGGFVVCPNCGARVIAGD